MTFKIYFFFCLSLHLLNTAQDRKRAYNNFFNENMIKCNQLRKTITKTEKSYTECLLSYKGQTIDLTWVIMLENIIHTDLIQQRAEVEGVVRLLSLHYHLLLLLAEGFTIDPLQIPSNDLHLLRIFQGGHLYSGPAKLDHSIHCLKHNHSTESAHRLLVNDSARFSLSLTVIMQN